ncbi:MAG: cation diffusion facilitator family transporter [Hyphomicrobiaceae bacterium]
MTADRIKPNQTLLVGLASIGVAIVVMALKYLAYLATGSVALYSDALESIVNVLTAIAAVLAIHIGARPADKSHQFGHHKAEYFAAVLEGTLIMVAALLILREAIDAFGNPRTIREPFVGVAINLAATVINAGWAWALIVRGRRWRSPALIADGLHILSDVMTSAGVLVGLLLAAWTGLRWLDPALAMVVAVHILWIGFRLLQGSASSLMDEAAPPEVIEDIRRSIAAHADGALQVHDIRTRIAGPATFIEFHLVVPGSMSVETAHEICDRIEDGLKGEIDGAQVVIHVEPEHKAKSKGALQM